MTKLKTLGLIGAAALALTATAASAQYGQYGQYGQHDRGYRDAPRGHQSDSGGQAYIDRVEWRVRRAQESGRISPRRAAYLLAQVRETRRIAWRYDRDGLNQWERADLNRRLNSVQMALRDQDRDGRDYGYGYGPDRRR
jgi:hypothetical protein